MERGRLITLEGPDGSGKTTQIELLEKYLKEIGYEVVRTREPGGTEISEKIRGIILDNDNSNMSYMCEALLYAASRAQLVSEVIKPALKLGKIVICDRFVYSSMVYQGIGRGLGMERIKDINEAALDGLEADLIFMITIPYEEGLRRKKMQGTLDRLENSGNEFHKKVFEGYLDICKKYDKIEVINGNRNVDEIHLDIIKAIKKIKL
ncbi:dTMP kinase [Clostridium bowmanii]|uniref:dTMP kinase n=1 Tax=Clostridium bowmanii TaxID=132925 RepID=UPI001C0CFAC0|nr:dTMP kinase [Clostridium bowmanii]MBU3189131.1 dTMP kinase [Clostridium bowmanii]MCA1073769.1 dTMP kinase [Clostridium bowmanii]